MADAVFVERELTARKGRKRTKLRLRVFAPVPHGAEYACSFELTGAQMPWPGPKQIYGYDGLQAFTLAMQFAGWTLLQFEIKSGMRIDAWHWWNIVELVAEMALSTHDRDRVNEIKTELRGLLRKDEQGEQATRKPRAAPASRKTRTAAAAARRSRK